MQKQDWPPAISRPPLPMPDKSFVGAQRRGRASAWLAGVGITGSLSMMLDSGFFMPGGLDHPMSGYFVSFFVGLICDLSGLWLGILSRKTMAGKIGLVLSLLALVSTPVLGLAYHAHNGNWPWLTEDDCRCP